MKATPTGSNDLYEIDDFGNSGIGKTAKYGDCHRCKRRNRIVGPLEAPFDLRSCSPTCEAQHQPPKSWPPKATRTR